MRIKERYQLAAELKERYWAAGRRERGAMLDAFCLTTGYTRKYAISMLRGRQRKPRLVRRPRQRHYGKTFQADLAMLWEAAGYICAERLRPFLPDLMQLLESHRQLSLSPERRDLLLAASTSTISRNLVHLRQQLRWPQRSLRPPSRLHREVPIRVRNWRLEGRPGYLEIDLVSHSGPWASGDWIYTLSGTDLETGWSELVPVMTKSQREVLAGLVRLRGQLPFPLLGMHIDNGHEFLNAAMVDYCREHEIELSRGRPFHSDDNPPTSSRRTATWCGACSATSGSTAPSSWPGWTDSTAIFSGPSTTASSRSCTASAGSRSASAHGGSTTLLAPRSSVFWRPGPPSLPRSRSWSSSTPRSAPSASSARSIATCGRCRPTTTQSQPSAGWWWLRMPDPAVGFLADRTDGPGSDSLVIDNATGPRGGTAIGLCCPRGESG